MITISFSQISGFISPILVGWIRDKTGSTYLALYILSAALFLGAEGSAAGFTPLDLPAGRRRTW
jgi:hypothetical protein